MMEADDVNSINRQNKPRILLIMRDPPDREANKGGVYPTAIRHHVDLGFDVYVASLSRMTRQHKEAVCSLGATPAIPPAGILTVQKIKDFLLPRAVRRSRGPDLTSLKSLSWVGKEINPNVITGLQSYPTGIVAREISNTLEVPFLTWEHVSTYERNKPLPLSDGKFIEFLKDAYAILVLSTSLRNAMLHRFSTKFINMSILPNPIPLNFAKPPQSPKPEWLDDFAENEFIFASWTSWRDLKRLDLLLSAFGEICGQVKDVKLIIVGSLDKGTLELVEDFTNRHPDIAKYVKFVGKVNRGAIRHLAEATDCCVVASDFETFGNQMAEALAVGTPVISTRCGGPEDILKDARLGELCEKGSADALCAAMLNVMNNREKFKRDEIAQIADGLLGDAAIQRKWADVYKDIVPGIGNNL